MNKNEYKNTLTKNKSGFTMIEIILVVVIIAILAGLTIPKMTGKAEQARETDAKNTIRTLSMAIETYEMEKGKYPPSLNELLKESDTGIPYVEKLPSAPWDDVTFSYVVPGANNKYSYDLSCTSPNGKLINNWDD